ncbi:MAG: rplJ [Gammaproteobacteria bacterium]|jgi:large subunit ribosomal protein L10|nr:rplJ [Gammaproteobacteria bacterium]
MPLKLDEKKTIVLDVSKVAEQATFAMVASYRGLTVTQMTVLRARARQANVYLRIVPNTLARRALQDSKFSCLQEALVGPMILLFSMADPGDVARLVRDFVKENQLFEVKALTFGQTLLPADELATVADLPTRDQALAMLMGVIQAPITKLVRTLAEPYAQCVRVVAAVGSKKEAA